MRKIIILVFTLVFVFYEMGWKKLHDDFLNKKPFDVITFRNNTQDLDISAIRNALVRLMHEKIFY